MGISDVERRGLGCHRARLFASRRAIWRRQEWVGVFFARHCLAVRVCVVILLEGRVLWSSALRLRHQQSPGSSAPGVGDQVAILVGEGDTLGPGSRICRAFGDAKLIEKIPGRCLRWET